MEHDHAGYFSPLHNLAARGHRKAWERALYYPREFGIRIFSRQSWNGTLSDNMRLSGEKRPLGRYTPGPAKLLPYKIKLQPNATQVPMLRKFELTFRLQREYENPYDPQL